MTREARLMEHDFMVSGREYVLGGGPTERTSVDLVARETQGFLVPRDLSSAVLTVVGRAHKGTMSKKLEWSPQPSQSPSPQWGRTANSLAQTEQSHAWSGTFCFSAAQSMQSMSPQRASMTGQYAARTSSSWVRWAIERAGGCKDNPPRPASRRSWRALLRGFLRLVIQVLNVILEDVGRRTYGCRDSSGPESPYEHQNSPHSGHSGSGTVVSSSMRTVMVFMVTPMPAVVTD